MNEITWCFRLHCFFFEHATGLAKYATVYILLDVFSFLDG